MTQEELAARSGVQTAYVSRLENGRSSPTLAKLEVIAKTLDVEVAQLFAHAPAGEAGGDEQTLLELWQGLTGEQRATVIDVMRAMM